MSLCYSFRPYGRILSGDLLSFHADTYIFLDDFAADASGTIKVNPSVSSSFPTHTCVVQQVADLPRCLSS